MRSKSILIFAGLFFLLASSTVMAQQGDSSSPIFNKRTMMWVVAELQLIFAAFLLGGPIFVVISEYIGYRKRDPKYDLFAKEFIRLLLFVMPITILFGVLQLFVLIGYYPNVSTYIFSLYGPFMPLMALLLGAEAFFMYAYYYTWDKLADRDKKKLHIVLGIGLNVVGTLLMLGANSITTFMMTPPKALVWGEPVALMDVIWNLGWWPLNLHRFIANVALGGFLAGFYAAVKYLKATTAKERAYYDWMGFVGNFIGVVALIPLPIAGYIFGKELSMYDPVYMIYTMAADVGWFFLIQGMLIPILFLGAFYYIWLSMKRIEGGIRFSRYIKALVIVLFIATAIWVTPHHFQPSMYGIGGHGGMEMAEIPKTFEPLALMQWKNTAAALFILIAFIGYMLYQLAISTGRMKWGEIDARALYTLVVLAFTVVLTMSLMGFVRSQARQDWHVYGVMLDTEVTSALPPTDFAMTLITLIAVAFFLILGFLIWFSAKIGEEPEIPEMSGGEKR
jgi:cytochrome bd-type quinol oxidase subunit 1